MEKVIDLEDRIPSFRQRRKRRTNLKFIIITTIFILLLLFLLYLQSSYSKIQTITVEGDKLEQQQFYIEQAEIALGQSMWSFKTKEVEEKLLQLEWLDEVDIKRDLFTSVTISLTEFEKVAYINKGEQYFPMLENGYIYENVNEQQTIDAPVFTQFEDQQLRNRLLKEMAKIDASILALISQVNAVPTDSDPYAITLYMNDGYEIRADLTTLADKINYYPSIIAQIESAQQSEKGIIDIEVGTYYQSFGNEYGDALPLILDEQQPAQIEQESNEQEPVEDELQLEPINGQPTSEGA